MQFEVKRAVGLAKKHGEKNTAILFSEDYLHYRLNISQKDACAAAEKMQKLLSPGCFIAFNVYQLGDFEGERLPANMGYLITSTRIFHQPKRLCSDGDADVIYANSGSRNYDYHVKAWEARGAKLFNEKKPFLSLSLPGGVKVEYRICCDAKAPPVRTRKNTITLLSCDGVWHEDFEQLASKRKALVANDTTALFPLVGGANGTSHHAVWGFEFSKVCLFDEQLTR